MKPEQIYSIIESKDYQSEYNCIVDFLISNKTNFKEDYEKN